MVFVPFSVVVKDFTPVVTAVLVQTWSEQEVMVTIVVTTSADPEAAAVLASEVAEIEVLFEKRTELE